MIASYKSTEYFPRFLRVKRNALDSVVKDVKSRVDVAETKLCASLLLAAASIGNSSRFLPFPDVTRSALISVDSR